MTQKPLIILAVLIWLSTMGYLILRTIEEMANLSRNLFSESCYLENTNKIPSYLGQVGTTIAYICFGIILLSIIICGLYLSLKKIFTYWRMIE